MQNSLGDIVYIVRSPEELTDYEKSFKYCSLQIVCFMNNCAHIANTYF